ncbi:hypothetical protein AVDCRST_MAG92-2760 [uncultured Coleofasciculus sp.]|uniref:Uncharacterized protein n=1 Tax=uncultured Coleofasciculus sp. TaxID=1267456 RepID=A0A6J4J2Q8_9CYAN|nr:hypothetical protein AVDCRST_MAG92-2760 [uncultured Coleofasciculus sp.]
MNLGAFFSFPVVFLAVAPTQLAAIVPIAGNTIQNTATVKSTLLAAKGDRVERMRFSRGANAATVSTSVVRGTRDTFLVAANRRQTMTVSITSLEKNAVFDIQGPNGQIIKQEATSWSGVLPTTGDYRIIVGGTRGNASYRLRVSVN